MVNSNGLVADWLDDAKKNAGWLIVLGVVTVIAGFFSLVMPWASGVGVAFVVGFALLVGGAARLVAAFSAGSFGRGTLAFIGGALCLLAGVIMVARPGSGLAVLTLMLGSYLIVDGIFGAVQARRVRSLRKRDNRPCGGPDRARRATRSMPPKKVSFPGRGS
jgi:uncharacterized membrane protein HdeD (DUF308 family)